MWSRRAETPCTPRKWRAATRSRTDRSRRANRRSLPHRAPASPRRARPRSGRARPAASPGSRSRAPRDWPWPRPGASLPRGPCDSGPPHPSGGCRGLAATTPSRRSAPPHRPRSRDRGARGRARPTSGRSGSRATRRPRRRSTRRRVRRTHGGVARGSGADDTRCRAPRPQNIPTDRTHGHNAT
jgi:hypothetical protein